MLTYEALIQEAKLRGMPAAKMRGILREYLQVLVLKELYNTDSGRKLMFTGGTYLRLIHRLKRFSEDLDFNAKDIKEREFEALTAKVKVQLRKRGIESLLKFSHWGNIYAADIIFPSIEKAYNITSNYSKKEGIIIKLETNRPKWQIKEEPELISGFGEMYPCVCSEKGVLFADKIDALGKKLKGRHLYDIIFMLTKRYPINKKALLRLGIKSGPLETIIAKVNNIPKAELQRQAEALRPFLFDESEAGLIANAHLLIPKLIKTYQES